MASMIESNSALSSIRPAAGRVRPGDPVMGRGAVVENCRTWRIEG